MTLPKFLCGFTRKRKTDVTEVLPFHKGWISVLVVFAAMIPGIDNINQMLMSVENQILNPSFTLYYMLGLVFLFG